MLGWFSSRRSAAPAATPAAAVVPVVSASPAPPGEPGASETTSSTLSWLLDGPPPVQAPPREAERVWLGHLDRQMAGPRLPADLLPRAALWLHGHLHCRHDYRDATGTRVLCNARGLSAKGEDAGWDPLRPVEA